ncbi:IPT/TIG domain-containing protein [Streptomyces zingiberis]|uniref:Cell surface receptor IPT/TIG domain-containing protein n=1 Tax=Streptomyces zingiberis TaxID=2053010 RepID=A0ABX1BT03_9ACTN|nr:IPT/TIG domain-containing protein [Streptomyces zingiberis]NJQ00218.1 cell surface receptor IPT/TIG domain-containing protein [Streptomyces zingiberis]
MPPVITALNPAQGPTTGGTTVSVTGTGLDGAAQVRFGPVLVPFTIAGPTRLDATAPPGTGSVPVTVRTGEGTSNSLTYTYVTAPVLITIAPTSGPTAGGNTVTLTGTGLTAVSQVRFGSIPVPFTVVSSTEITATAPPGTGTVTVTVRSSGGTSNGLAYTYVTAPVLSAIVPNNGPTTGGTTVVLTGTNLTGATGVSFGGTPATSFTVDGPTQITAVAPAGTAGSVSVTVTTPGGPSNAVTYTYTAAVPVISNITPATGPLAGSQTVVLTGTGFTGATLVRFGLVSAISFTVNSSTQITAVTPPGAVAGPIGVTVTTPSGVSAPSTYTYAALPTVSQVLPGLGPEAGENTVTVYGSGFTSATLVQFDGAPAPSFTVVDDFTISATAPAGTGTVAVTVTSPGGTSDPMLGNPYYIYVPVPSISGIVPNQASTGGGTSISISGVNLTYTDSVTFGGTPATSFAALSDLLVVATAPAHAPGATTLVLHTPGGSASVPITYA